MSDELRVHIGYVAVDAQGYRALRRRLASWEAQRLIRVTESGESPNLELELADSAIAAADLYLVILSPACLASTATGVSDSQASSLLAQLLARCSGSDGRPRVVGIRYRALGAAPLPIGPLTLLPQSGPPLDEAKDPGLAWARIDKELAPILYALRTLPRRPAPSPPPPVAAPLPMVRTAAASESAVAAQVVPLSGLSHHKWALLVGINRFADSRRFPRLSYCKSDVRILAQTLRDQGYQVVTLDDEQERPQLLPYLRNVQSQLTALVERAQAEDLVLVHFACHGFIHRGQQLLAMMDTRGDNPEATALSVATLCERLRKCAARRRVLILDACQAGAALTRGSDDDEFIRQSFELAEGFVRIAASTADQLAQEWAAEQMGVFSYFLNQALLGTARARNQFGLVTAQSAANYLLFELRKWSREHLGREQEPTISYEGLGELVLADYRGVPPKEPA